MMSSSPLSLTFSGSLSYGNPSSPPRRMKSLNELYKVTTFIDDYVMLYCHLAIYDPIMFEEAINDEKWRIVMDEKIASIKKNDTWKLVPRPNEKKPIGVKWIYKEKKNAKG